MQIARSRGAQVIATVRGDTGEAHRLGVDEVYDTEAVDAIDALHKAHPDGVDGVLDLVNGPDTIGRDADIIKSGGTLVSTIFAADERWFADRHITAHNSASSANPLLSSEGLTEISASTSGRHHQCAYWLNLGSGRRGTNPRRASQRQSPRQGRDPPIASQIPVRSVRTGAGSGTWGIRALGGIRPSRPASKSSTAWPISSRVFITNGP